MPLPFHLVLLGVSFSESIHLQLCPLHRLCPHFSSPPIQQPQQQPSERGPSHAPGPPFFSSLILFSLLLPPLPFCGTSSAPRGPQLRLEPQGAVVVPRKPEQHLPIAIDQSLLQPTTLAHASTDPCRQAAHKLPEPQPSPHPGGKWPLWSKPATQRVSKLNNTSASRGISFAGCRRILKSLRAM